MKTAQSFSFIVFGLIMVLLSGCQSVGIRSIKNETVESVSRKIVPKQTSMTEVEALFGPPLETSYTDSGLPIWKYTFSTSKWEVPSVFIALLTLGLVDITYADVKDLTILFDEKNIVKKSNLSESEVGRWRGLVK